MATEKGHFLSPHDRELVQEIITEVKRQIGNRPIYTDREEDQLFTPETYIAFTPEGGIPARTEGPGTGSGAGQDDVMAYADCEVYQKVYISGVEYLKRTGFTRRVFNLSDTAIPQFSWVVITRDKWGTWIAIPTAVGSSDYLFGDIAGIVNPPPDAQDWAISSDDTWIGNPSGSPEDAITIGSTGAWAIHLTCRIDLEASSTLGFIRGRVISNTGIKVRNLEDVHVAVAQNTDLITVNYSSLGFAFPEQDGTVFHVEFYRDTSVGGVYSTSHVYPNGISPLRRYLMAWKISDNLPPFIP